MDIKAKIKEAKDIKKETVDVPEWEVKVEVRSMSGAARAEMLDHVASKDGFLFRKLYPDILIACLYDPETGESLFVDADKDWLMEKSGGPIEMLANKAVALSGLTADAMGAIEKNSNSDTLNDDSITI